MNKEELKDQIIGIGKQLLETIAGKDINLHIKKDSEGLGVNAKMDKTKVNVTKKHQQPVEFDLHHGNDEENSEG